MTRSGLLVAGSVAIDSLQNGRITGELGGSALYFSLAASLLVPVLVVAPVGADAAEQVRERLAARGEAIDANRLDVVDAPTYRWFAADDHGQNRDLGSQDSIYDAWSPRIPSGYRGWAFVGSMRPDRQLEAAIALDGCGLLAADAMRSYVEASPGPAQGVLARAGWYFGNEEELAALGGGDPPQFRRRWGLAGLVLKRGPGGATVFTDAGEHHEPALFDPPAVDTTGAGDALAGAMLGRWLELGGRAETLPEALRWGVAAATIAISGVGQRSLVRATRTDLEVLVAGPRRSSPVA
ncbi:MAG: PfkB family carbohydrate kinase [Candidatus Dormibacteraeota bacterium]|nr:PfkB family carbohydrate kinase [Candidatus Dormibacteraeota bacterium]